VFKLGVPDGMVIAGFTRRGQLAGLELNIVNCQYIPVHRMTLMTEVRVEVEASGMIGD
jgi:hypothetical protein